MDMVTEEVKPKKKWKYVPGKNVRSHIAKWEAEDFAGQNAKFGGDAVGAKAKELQNLLGEDIGKRLTTKELDGLLATYYNLSPDSFKRVILPTVKEYAMDPTVLNSNKLYDTMMNRYKIAPAKYLKGIKRRAAADTGLMGIQRSEPLILELTADGGKILTVDPSVYGLENHGFESTWKPVLPIKTDYNLNNPTPQSISSWSGKDAPNATPRVKDFLEALNEALKPVWDAFSRYESIGHRSPFNLSLSLPKLGDLLALNTPYRLMQEYFANVLGLSDIQPQMPSLFPRLKNGKLPKYSDGDTPEYAPVESVSEVTITPDPELRLRVNLTWPDPNVRKQALNEVERYKRYTETPAYVEDYRTQNDYRDTGQTGSKARVKDVRYGLALPANYEVERVMQIVDASGNPTASSYLGDAHTKAGASTYSGNHITVNTNDPRDPYISELSHAYQHANGLYELGHTNRNELGSQYYDPESVEYLAHNVILPAIYQYSRAPERFDTDKLQKKVSRDIERTKKSIMYRLEVMDAPEVSHPKYKDGKPIRIKPANRGKLTRLKKRTGKSEAELYRTGGPSVRKMITFARNARKWKH